MVTESIFDGEKYVIPMCDILAIEKLNSAITPPFHYRVIMAGTTFNHQAGDYNNDLLLRSDEGNRLLAAWCKYRYEIEQPTIEEDHQIIEEAELKMETGGDVCPGIKFENNGTIHLNFKDKEVQPDTPAVVTDKKVDSKISSKNQIMRTNDGKMVVAFTADSQGYVIRCSPSDSKYKVGDYRNDWCALSFFPMEGNEFYMKECDIFALIVGVINSVFDTFKINNGIF